MHGLDLSPGSILVLDSNEWVVEQLEPQFGHVMLVACVGGQRMQVSFGFLAFHPDCRASSRTAAALAAARGRQEPSLEDLTEHQRKLVALRMAHLLEVETGYRSGDPLRAEPGEPKPCYDPAVTSLTQRRLAKAEELAALDTEHARLLGLHRVGLRTLIRWDTRRRDVGAIGCADDRWLRPMIGRHVSDQVREAIHAVHTECLHRSRISMVTKERLIHQYVLEQFGPEATQQIPSYPTLRRVWLEWFGPTGGRQRYVRSAAKTTSGEHVVVHRPGQVVALDSTILPVKVRDTVFGDPVSVHLTLAMDVFTRSLVGFRLTLVSDSAIDVAMLLRDIMMPLPMRPDWGQDMEWPYPGLPATLVTEFAGHRVAGLPFFSPETVTTDHGSVYRNHALVETQRVLGCNILPARVLRPTDKQTVERAFGSARSLLFEELPGYTGVDVADRGDDPEADAALTVDADGTPHRHLDRSHLAESPPRRTCPVLGPDRRPQPEHSVRSSDGPGRIRHAGSLPGALLPTASGSPRRHPPRTRSQDPRTLLQGRSAGPLPAPAVDRGGKHKRRYVIRRDPRDAPQVFFQDPKTHQWEALRWTGLPPQDEVPAFGDARVDEMLSAARRSGLKPQTDRELLPLLLDLIGSHIPVEPWPTMPKTKRTDHARDDAQGRGRCRRPGYRPAAANRPSTTTCAAKTPTIVDPLAHPRARGHGHRRFRQTTTPRTDARAVTDPACRPVWAMRSGGKPVPAYR